jgi:hyperosmotically inducible periplasmic protein
MLAGLLDPGLAGCNKPTPPAPARQTDTSGSAQVDDIDVSARVKTALLGDAQIKGFDITVLTLKGDVRLTGMVNEQSEIDQAEAVARGVTGVHSIHNELSVKK